MPQLLPGFIANSLEKARQEYERIKLFLKDEKEDLNLAAESNLSEILGDVSRILANEAYWLEETVDDLFSIALFGRWDTLREKIPDWLYDWEKHHKDNNLL